MVTAASTNLSSSQQRAASRVKYPCALWDKPCKKSEEELRANGQIQGKTGLGEKRRARLRIAIVIPHRLSLLLKADGRNPLTVAVRSGLQPLIVLHICSYCWEYGCILME